MCFFFDLCFFFFGGEALNGTSLLDIAAQIKVRYAGKEHQKRLVT